MKSFTTTYISPHTMMGTITPDLMTTAGKLQIVVTTPTAASASTDPTTFWVYPPGPQIMAVANTASYTANTVSPGGIITIYGINLGPTRRRRPWSRSFPEPIRFRRPCRQGLEHR